MPSRLEALDVQTFMHIWHFLLGPWVYCPPWVAMRHLFHWGHQDEKTIAETYERAIYLCSKTMRNLFLDARREEKLRMLRATLPLALVQCCLGEGTGSSSASSSA